MKIYLIIMSIVFMSCNSQEIKSNNDYNIKGGVEYVEEITNYPEYELKSIYSFDENDYVLFIEDYHLNNLIERKQFKYDTQNIISEIVVSGSNGKKISKSKFLKNNKNQIEKTLVNSPNGKSILLHHYDNNSQFPESGKEMNDKGEIIRAWKLEYKNQVVSVQRNFTPEGIVISQTTFIHNDNNDLIEVIEKDIDGIVLNRQYSEYQYDNRKNWVQRILYDSDKNLISTSNRKITYY